MTDVPGRLSTRATTALRVFLTLLVAAMAVLWVYAFFLAPSGNPDRMEDRRWPEAAQARCQAARDEISDLPTARQTQAKYPQKISKLTVFRFFRLLCKICMHIYELSM